MRTPVVLVDFGQSHGSVIISQLITEGRLVQKEGENDLYGKRYDPVAVQFVLNLLNEVAKNNQNFVLEKVSTKKSNFFLPLFCSIFTKVF